MKKLVISFLLIASLLAACAPAPTPSAAVENTPIIVVITATPELPTSTPAATATPEATSTPTFARWTADQAAQSIDAAGLEFVSPAPMTKDDYGMAPMLGQGTRFLVPSICADCGGRLFVFDNQGDLEKMKSYYEGLAQQSAMFFSWVFTRDNILIQINGDLPEEQALKYQAALDGMQ